MSGAHRAWREGSACSCSQEVEQLPQKNFLVREEGRMRGVLDQGVLRRRQMIRQPVRGAFGGQGIVIALYHQRGVRNACQLRPQIAFAQHLQPGLQRGGGGLAARAHRQLQRGDGGARIWLIERLQRQKTANGGGRTVGGARRDVVEHWYLFSVRPVGGLGESRRGRDQHQFVDACRVPAGDG